MSQFGRSLFGRTTWMFWVLAPIAFVSALLFSLVAYGGLRSGDWAAGGIGLALTISCVLLILVLWGRGMAWAGRGLCGIVALAYLVYLVHEWGWDRESLPDYHGRSQAHPINATLGFLVIGLPCAFYAFLGRFTWSEKAEMEVVEDDDQEEESDEDDLPEQEHEGRERQ
ncbi:hypothetical protein [Verrucomicrobium sp. BvORR034]|uniref:hypothetical protein n=1 Tax=Verrucomicrobium sp. BvORR034 TaxID=1396418 RepID=UPI002241027D|nr:hypothetical protein [Verrucomicrobium sp. BvORR034]